MKSMREEYFENYRKVQTPAKNRRGFTTSYQYIGEWYDWDLEPNEKKKRKILFFAAEAFSILLYMPAALIHCRFNSMRISSGLAVLSLVPWIAELWGVMRLILQRKPMTVSDFNGIRNCITIGSVLRIILLGAAVLTGAILLTRDGSWTVANVMSIAGHLLSGAVSLFVFRGYTGLPYQLYNSLGKYQILSRIEKADLVKDRICSKCDSFQLYQFADGLAVT